MGRKRQPSREKKIKPQYWVFCEGQTEEAYICFLRSKYRIPIEIVSKITGNNIDDRKIKNYKKGKPSHEKDIDFLLYDGDVEAILNRLKRIENVTLLISNPSIELWFLLHYKNQKSEITTKKCVEELTKRNKTEYKKGIIDLKLGEKLNYKFLDACKRALELKDNRNPSSSIYKLIEVLEKIKKEYQ